MTDTRAAALDDIPQPVAGQVWVARQTWKRVERRVADVEGSAVGYNPQGEGVRKRFAPRVVWISLAAWNRWARRTGARPEVRA